MILDLGCVRGGTKAWVPISFGRHDQFLREAHHCRVWILHKDITPETELDAEFGSALFNAHDPINGGSRIELSFLCREGAAMVELNKATLAIADEKADRTIRIFHKRTLLLTFEVNKLKGTPDELIAVDLGNNATACARYAPENPVLPATDITISRDGKSFIDSCLYALAFVDEGDSPPRFLDDSFTFVTADHYDELTTNTGAYDFSSDYLRLARTRKVKKEIQEPEKKQRWSKRRKDEDGTDEPEEVTDWLAIAKLSRKIESFKAWIGSEQDRVDTQVIDFGDDADVSLRHAAAPNQNLIVTYLSRVLSKAGSVSQYLYTLPELKGINPEGGPRFHELLSYSAGLVSSSLRCAHDSDSFYPEGWAASCYHVETMACDTLNVPRRELHITIEIGAGHLHVVPRVFDLPEDADDLHDASFHSESSATTVLAGEFITLGPYFHLLKTQRWPGGDGRERHKALDAVYDFLEATKLRKQAALDTMSMDRILPYFNDRLIARVGRDEYPMEVKRAIIQILRNAFFTGLPTLQSLTEFSQTYGTPDQKNALIYGYRSAMNFAPDLEPHPMQTQQVPMSRAQYQSYVYHHFCVDTFPEGFLSPKQFGPTNWQTECDLICIQDILNEFWEENKTDWHVTIHFSGRASLTEPMIDLARQAVEHIAKAKGMHLDVIAGSEGQVAIDYSRPEVAIVGVENRAEIDSALRAAKAAVSHGALYWHHDTRRRQLRDRFEDELLEQVDS